MKLVCSAIGSRGDVRPVIEIATRFARRGHDVQLIVPALFERTGQELRLKTVCYTDDSEKVMASLSAGWTALREALHWIHTALDDQFAKLLEATHDADAMVTTINEFAAPTVAEHRRIPHFRVTYAPLIPGDQPPPVQPLMRLPAFANRALWAGINAGSLMVFGKPLNERRQRFGLPPVRRFGEYVAGRAHTLLAFNPVLGPPARGWRWAYDYVGYPFGGDTGPLDDKTEQFLASGSAPIYLGLGSVKIPDPLSSTRMILEAIDRVGCRAILSAGWTGLGRDMAVPRSVHLLTDAPHATLFPRLAGAAHHGGSGTTHNAARAGIPQVVLPQFIDQYYWGDRIWKLGLGPRPTPFGSLTAKRLAQALRDLTRAEHANQARTFAHLMRDESGAETAADLIESSLRGEARWARRPALSLVAGAPAPMLQ